ncbi:Histone protein [Janthinobacterium sp. CG23_2]|nr:Histone protein [Janthinobacterium sp. CG23_2]CUU31168.1 Histone protein [Janthinobacterium sp. CG23_2]
MAGRARSQQDKPAPAKAPASGAGAAAMTARRPSPAVAAAILAGAERTARVHATAPGRKPPEVGASAPAQVSATPVPAVPAPAPAKPAQLVQKAAPATLSALPTAGIGGAAGTRAAKAQAPSATPAAPEAATKGAAPSVAKGAAPSTLPAGAAAGPASEAAQTEAQASAPAAPAKRAAPAGAGAKPGKEQAAAAPAAGEEGGAESGAGAAAGTTLALKMPEPPAGPSAATMKRIGAVQARAGGAAAAKAALPPGEAQAGAAQKAVNQPEAEAKAQAQSELVAMLGATPAPSAEIDKLCERIREVIRNKRPPDEDALMEAKPDAEAQHAGDQLNASVEGETKKVQGGYGAINNTPAGAAPAQGQPLPEQPEAAASAPVNAKAATPDAVPAGNVSLDADAEASKKQIKDAGMESPTAQLVTSGPVAEARGAQGELDQAAKEDPAKVLAGQKEALAKAEGNMAALQQQALTALTVARATTAKGTGAQQEGMVVSEEAKRTKASADAQQAFSDAQKAVSALLAPLSKDALDKWEAAKTLLVAKFKADLAPVQERVNQRHEGASGFVVGVWDAVTGLPGWAEEGYKHAEESFADGVINKLKEISAEVNTVIATCELLIKTARDKIAKIFSDLGGGLADWAAQQRAEFDGKLDKLQEQAIATRDNFNKDLMDNARQAVDEVRAEIAELRKKAGGLLGRIANAIARFIDDPVKFIIEGLLELLGIPPAAFWAVVAKIKKVVKDIADDPMKFAGNLLKGLAEGFGKFFDNFGTHLLKGFLGWLLGGLKDVQVPKDVSVKSIITFFLQLMGITWPNIRKILVKLVGAKNVALIEKVYSLVSLLMDKGPEGIYEMIKEKLDPQAIVDQVVDMAIDYMVTAIMKQVAVRIVMLFNPAGAIVQALEAIYRVLKWIFQNAARIFTLVETVVNGIADVLAGNTGGFATAVEKALGMLIAPVISFIADYLSLGDLPGIVAEKVKSMREWILGMIEKALAWMIEKGKALLAAVGIGKKDKDKKGKEGGGDIGKKVTWTAEDESHEMWIEVNGSNATVMMASEGAGKVQMQLNAYETTAKALKRAADKPRRKKALDHIEKARSLLTPVDKTADEAASLTQEAEVDPAKSQAKEAAVESAEDALWPHLQAIQIALRIIDIPITDVQPTGGAKASSVTAMPLTKKPGNTIGSSPGEDPPGWDHVGKIDRERLNPKSAQLGPRFWRRMHVLSDQLHGPGEAWNLVPAVEKDNSAMKNGPEAAAKKLIADDEVIYYRVNVSFYSGKIVEDFPSAVTVEYGSMRYESNKWVEGDRLGGLPLRPAQPSLDGKAVSINTLGRDALFKMGLPFRLAESIAAEAPYADAVDLRTKMDARYSNLARPVNFNTEYWSTVKSFISDKGLIF